MNAAQHQALLYANASGATFSSWVTCGFTWRTIFRLRDVGLLRMGERYETGADFSFTTYEPASEKSDELDARIAVLGSSRRRRIATWRITAAGRRALAQIKARRARKITKGKP